jgi:hypothetical protein
MKTQAEIDMTPQAVAARLDDVRALYRLMLYLARFKPIETAAAHDVGAEPSSRESGHELDDA